MANASGWSDAVLYLHLCDLPPNVRNDKPDDGDVIYFESLIECFEDTDCDKYSFFDTQTKELALFMKKLYYDLRHHNRGNYCKNHVLIDALLMYKTYLELVNDSAFGHNLFDSCIGFVTNIFKIFSLHSRIVLVVPPGAGLEVDNLSKLLEHLLQQSIVEIG
ncbi:ac93 [Lambdina fiscellaria nucleopolyhedrovirus]|uniref:Ac93 n=1 Tax=Lambdina fiscellaria nucleopolyhedrovirus TaxID=1642929 RepID=A0A0E3URQ8_9ABAC|nr:ac93 [Lambdina fiscellaria nucleopolyhedrovirus]AKC91684.1 ac93 [Lambdina fiscellaria nucleopolyhedrovirus]